MKEKKDRFDDALHATRAASKKESSPVAALPISRHWFFKQSENR
jgi:hypothetical protein